jgi:hypothetical protein
MHQRCGTEAMVSVLAELIMVEAGTSNVIVAQRDTYTFLCLLFIFNTRLHSQSGNKTMRSPNWGIFQGYSTDLFTVLLYFSSLKIATQQNRRVQLQDQGIDFTCSLAICNIF